ncbi:hypothetical protein SELMODRAFT_234957 [Selaginella moellendorffii]|uniref:Glucan endo-1,3-beta-D-glucosidase n=1 Tax=Selaginella moellendorffii TaxID=88036 RepID=D8SS36_SELML|nr:glucan endo-1,3-beta-glucosidase 14 [Selaginella moellendorffii]EFJ12673.1 hypothetical protein SELMODRAFT_234957 [Selaginella moellendorffii]|eukprot:XP_002986142.1 glucan endo-1,3-beta-glucosidase 14 [Selaginella moellendorffii]
MAVAPPQFGVNYGRVASNLPRPNDVANLVAGEGISRVRILDIEPAVLRAFARFGSPVRMSVTLPTEMIFDVAMSESCARAWFYQHIFPYRAQIETILVGNEILTLHQEMARLLVPAMENLHRVLVSVGMSRAIRVSTAHAMDILDSTDPPSSGSFGSKYRETLRRMLYFLLVTNSSFTVNVYPYYVYQQDKGRTVSLDYALGNVSADAMMDPHTGLNYTSLLKAQLDAVYSAMTKLGYGGVRLVVSETGWPSSGGFGASKKKSCHFFCNLLQEVSSGAGTPLRPHHPIQAYHFALFNENLKRGAVEQNFGIFYPNMTRVYPCICSEGVD